MKKLIILFFILNFTVLIGCGEKEYFVPKKVYYKGIKLYKKGNYEDAKEYLKKAIYKAKNLKTIELMEARFYLADTYYREENYIDAIVEFEEFLALFPTSKYVPEALYKLADSYLKVSPDPDKDLTYMRKAYDKAEELIENHPKSPFVKKAKEIMRKVKLLEVKHYLSIADLYEHLGKYYGAVRYYQYLLDNYSDYIDKKKILKFKAKNLLKLRLQYEDELKDTAEKINELKRKIKLVKDEEKKKVLRNRIKVYQEYREKLLKRITDGKKEAKSILSGKMEN